MSTFNATVEARFPGTMVESEFVELISKNLNKKGFDSDNTIACVGVCRDEICGTLHDEVKKFFGDPFSLRGLGGFIFCGHTGFGAAHAHSPLISGRDKYLYVVAPHIGISEHGQIGECSRRGRENPSHACGALAAFHGGLEKGAMSPQLNMNDIEMSIMSQLLIKSIPWGNCPDLAEITMIAANIIAEQQLEEIIKCTVDTSKADYAVIAGVQIHGPGLNNSFFCPLPKYCYTVVENQKAMVDVHSN